ncbi:hypothetical protein D3Y55_26965 [Mesorhizobium sp. DCY119]|nr:hypothetical protein D3Y55_26965 [Mesorhizobium sp. DCY119]
MKLGGRVNRLCSPPELLHQSCFVVYAGGIKKEGEVSNFLRADSICFNSPIFALYAANSRQHQQFFGVRDKGLN